MDETTLHYLKSKVANSLMRYHGYDRRDPLQKEEFNPENPNSQYSMMFADADIAVTTLLDTLMDLDIEDGEDVPATNPLLGVVHPDTKVDTGEPEEELFPEQVPKPTAVSISSALFIFMETPPGQPAYVSDVRDWLASIDDAGIPDDTEVDGHLHLSYDREHSSATKIECGDCGKFDTVLAEHHCPAWEPIEDPKLFYSQIGVL